MEPIGSHEYRAFVGPPDEYDLMGATQFSLMCALGLREHHRLLDIGCGSLRGGRLFITYLNAGGYTGLEPNRWLVDEAVDNQIGRDVLDLKAPVFIHNEQFDLEGLCSFDFVIAQSIASHTGPAMTQSLFGTIESVLTSRGIGALTFIHGSSDQTDEGWQYPDCVKYRRETVRQWLRDAGLRGTPIAWYHPRQTWWIVTPVGSPLPPRQLLFRARGAMLPYPKSWDLRAQVHGGLVDVGRGVKSALQKQGFTPR